MEYKDQAFEGWMRCIETKGWLKADLATAAELAGLEKQQVLISLGDKINALALLQDKIADASATGATYGTTIRERLFDGLMEGFDVLQNNRKAIEAIARSFDPGVAVLLTGRIGLHVRRLALAAGMDVRGLRGHLRLMALSGLILRAFHIWRRDQSADMSGTMAALDRLLDKAHQAETKGVSPDLLGLPGLSSVTGYFAKPK